MRFNSSSSGTSSTPAETGVSLMGSGFGEGSFPGVGASFFSLGTVLGSGFGTEGVSNREPVEVGGAC